MRYTYPVVLIPEDDDGYSVLVPDLPGCATQGETVEEALEMAKDATAGWIEVAVEDQEEIPQPSALENIAQRLGEILESVAEPEVFERVILANIQIDAPKAAA